MFLRVYLFYVGFASILKKIVIKKKPPQNWDDFLKSIIEK